MAKFLLLYTGGWGMPADDAGQAEVKAAWGAWFGRMGDAVVGGESLGRGRSVDREGVHDGPTVDPRPDGFMLIEAADFDAAVAEIRDHPHVRFGGRVTVFETV